MHGANKNYNKQILISEENTINISKYVEISKPDCKNTLSFDFNFTTCPIQISIALVS